MTNNKSTKIYDKLVIDPNDVTILASKDKTIREVTLITCTRNSDTEQTVYILELTNVQKY